MTLLPGMQCFAPNDIDHVARRSRLAFSVRETARVRCLLRVKTQDSHAVFRDNASYLLFAEPTCVAGTVPIKVRDDRSRFAELLAPEALEKVPVYETLDINPASLNAKRRNFRCVERDLELAEPPAKFGQLLRH